MRYRIVFFLIFAIFMPGYSYAQMTGNVQTPLSQINNAYGIRIGTGFRDGDPEAKPVFNPYFEVPIGTVLISAELQLVFTDFPTLYKLNFESYGWAGKLRWFYDKTSDNKFFSSVGLGMTVHQTNASIEIPISTGYLWKLSKETEFEGLVNFTPLDYLGQRLGWFVSATVGLRFLNF